MRKIMKILIALLLMVSFSNPIKANENNEILYDENVIMIPNDYIEIQPDQELLNSLSKDNMTVRTFKKVTESPSINLNSRSISVDEYDGKVETFSLIIPDAEGGGGSQSEDGWIVSYSAYIYSTVNYKRKTVDNISYIKVTGGNGGASDFNSGFRLVKQDIKFTAQGVTLDGASNKTIEKSTTNNTWQYTVELPYVNTQGYYVTGCQLIVTITHGTPPSSSTYSGKLLNNV